MTDYSDIIFLIGAMTLFAILSTNVSRSMVLNNQKLSKTEVEYAGIALAKGLVDRAQWAASKAQLEPGSSEYLFSDYSASSLKKEIVRLGAYEQFEVDYQIYVIVKDTNVTAATNKKITVGITSEYLTDQKITSPSDFPIRLEFIKSFNN